MSERDRILMILQNNEAARSDDHILYADLLKDIDIPFEAKNVLIDCLYNHVVLQMPNFHTVLRARREVQRKHPELTDSQTLEFRKIAEEEFRNAYKSQ